MGCMDCVALMSVYFLGIFTQIMADDSSSIVQVRMEVMNLETLLTGWEITDHNRPVDFDVKKIQKIKNSLRLLNVHYAGLSIGCPKLQKLINSSLELIRRYKKHENEPQNKPSFIGVELLCLWGCEKQSFEATEIRKLTPFLEGNFFKRLWLRITSKNIRKQV